MKSVAKDGVQFAAAGILGLIDPSCCQVALRFPQGLFAKKSDTKCVCPLLGMRPRLVRTHFLLWEDEKEKGIPSIYSVSL